MTSETVDCRVLKILAILNPAAATLSSAKINRYGAYPNLKNGTCVNPYCIGCVMLLNYAKEVHPKAEIVRIKGIKNRLVVHKPDGTTISYSVQNGTLIGK